MRVSLVIALAAVVAAAAGAPLHAQEPPPRIGPFAVDVRGAFPDFPQDPQLAQSRALEPSGLELPRVGLGVDAGVHLYFARWSGVTFGIGAQVTAGRASSEGRVLSAVSSTTKPTELRAVTQTLRSVTPQLSLNFGSGDGWSYISGGMGQAIWSVRPDRTEGLASDRARLRTFNYGGGARWFIKRHLAFHVDARFHEMHPGPPEPGLPATPRTTMLVLGAGISLK